MDQNRNGVTLILMIPQHLVGEFVRSSVTPFFTLGILTLSSKYVIMMYLEWIKILFNRRIILLICNVKLDSLIMQAKIPLWDTNYSVVEVHPTFHFIVFYYPFGFIHFSKKSGFFSIPWTFKNYALESQPSTVTEPASSIIFFSMALCCTCFCWHWNTIQ